MANVQQAAKWLMEGHNVQRRSRAGMVWLVPWEPMRFIYETVCADGGEHELDCHDLLADDWELCEGAATE